MKYIMIVVFALGVSACGNTMSGFKTDIDSKRQAMSDFLNPTLSSDEVEEEE
jgi:predicted small secreted protein